VKRVLMMYFAIVKQNLLNGYEHDFPLIGKAFIAKKRKERHFSAIPNSIYKYVVRWQDELLDRCGMTFKVGNKFLSDILKNVNNNNADYRIDYGC
jgi:hypothetical protein